MTPVDRDGSIINVIIGLIVILASIAGALSQAWQKMRKGHAPDDADLEAGLDPEDEDVESPAKPSPERRPREPRARAAPVAASHEGESGTGAEAPGSPAGPTPAPRPDSEPAKGRPRLTLDERIFANRRLTSGAKLLLSKEILDRPRGRRAR